MLAAETVWFSGTGGLRCGPPLNPRLGGSRALGGSTSQIPFHNDWSDGSPNRYNFTSAGGWIQIVKDGP